MNAPAHHDALAFNLLFGVLLHRLLTLAALEVLVWPRPAGSPVPVGPKGAG